MSYCAQNQSDLSGGHLFPDRASLFMAGIEDAEYREEKLLDMEWSRHVSNI